MTYLRALAKRCEQAKEPDRALDYEIHGRNGLWGIGLYGAHPKYTGSVDAALTLVPEGYDWIVSRTNGGLTIHAEVGGSGNDFRHFGDTPALALAAAALYAQQEEHDAQLAG